MGDRHAQLAKVVDATDRRGRDKTRIAKGRGYFARTKRGSGISGMQNVHEVLLTCFFAVPICVLFTFVAKRSEHSDSLRWAASGERFRNIKVLEFPLSEFCSRYVNFEFRYGICLSLFSLFSPSAAMTSPSALKLLLIFCVSCSRSLYGRLLDQN